MALTRRHFLETTAATIAFNAVPLLGAEPGRKYRNALIGTGWWGKNILKDAQLQEPDGHNLTLLWADFLDSIEDKRKSVANIEIAHRSSVLPLLGMISWRVGRSINWDGAKE